MSNIKINMREKQHYCCFNWTSYILFTVLLNNILIGASPLVPASRIQLLRGGDGDEIKLGERNGWKKVEPEETANGLHLLSSSRLKRVKRGMTAEQKRYNIILASCVIGSFVFICYLVPCAVYFWGYLCGCGYNASQIRRRQRRLQQQQEMTTTSATQRDSPRTTREGGSPSSYLTAPMLPEKPLTDQNGPELPPNYATAVLENEKIAELDKRFDQQREVIDAQNARLAEQEEKLAEMNRRLIENEQISAVADSTKRVTECVSW